MNRGNYQKTPVGASLNRIATQIVTNALNANRRALPCTVVAVSGQIVTVNFEVDAKQTLPQVTMPIIGAEYIRYPTQVGDKGFTIPASVYLGGISGLGGGVASMAPIPNLSALVFVPIGQKGFSAVNPNAVVIYGPDGVELRNTSNTANMTLLPTSITLSTGASSITMTESSITLSSPLLLFDGDIQQGTGGAAGTATLIGPLNVTNDVIAGTVSLENHLNSGVTAGGANSGPPVPGT